MCSGGVREGKESGVTKDSGAFNIQIGKLGKGTDLGRKMLNFVLECWEDRYGPSRQGAHTQLNRKGRHSYCILCEWRPLELCGRSHHIHWEWSLFGKGRWRTGLQRNQA